MHDHSLKWKVFVASTAKDLEFARKQISQILIENDFDTIMYDYGDHFISDSDVHSHKSCVESIELADIFLLILDKRSGGKYIESTTDNLTITRKEYETAKTLNLPNIILIKNNLIYEYNSIIKKIREAHPGILESEIPNAILNEKVSYAESPKLIEFIRFIAKQQEGNLWEEFDADNLEYKLKKRLKNLSYTMLKRLSNRPSKKK